MLKLFKRLLTYLINSNSMVSEIQQLIFAFVLLCFVFKTYCYTLCLLWIVCHVEWFKNAMNIIYLGHVYKTHYFLTKWCHYWHLTQIIKNNAYNVKVQSFLSHSSIFFLKVVTNAVDVPGLKLHWHSFV